MNSRISISSPLACLQVWTVSQAKLSDCKSSFALESFTKFELDLQQQKQIPYTTEWNHALW
jgi:hypothetical protein